MDGIVTNVQRYSLNDGSGIRTIVFLKGCPLKCQWCSNPETQDRKPQIIFHPAKCINCELCRQNCSQHLDLPENINRSECTACGACVDNCPTIALELVGKTMRVDDVLKIVEKDRAFYREDGGLTISGGEVLAQWEFATELAERAKNGYHLPVAIETTGFAPWEHLYSVAQHCDQILYDVKHTDNERHIWGTGVSNRRILDNLTRLAAKMAERIIIRIALIDGFNADEQNIHKTCELAKSLGISEIHLLPYHKFGEPKYLKLGRVYDFVGRTPTDETIEKYTHYLHGNGFKVVVGG